MPLSDETLRRLGSIPLLQLNFNEPLSNHTRFAFGGPADLLATTSDEAAYLLAVRAAIDSGSPWLAIGAGTNLIVNDQGFRGIVLRFDGAALGLLPNSAISAQAGAPLQSVVDASVAAGLSGLESLTGIPGSTGAAVYGNAGAYGASIADSLSLVRFFDGHQLRHANRDACQFRYRSSIFKRQRLQGNPWLILSVEFTLAPGDPAALASKAGHILDTRNRKFPPDLQCAGSIFKNLLLSELPPRARNAVPPEIIKGGKVPAAWFLDQVGARGLHHGGIRVKDDHANTLYNAGGGTAADFCRLAAELKARVLDLFDLPLEEEVQYVGF